MDLDRIDAERGGPMVVRERKQIVVVPAARDLHWRLVAGAVGSPHTFGTLVWPIDAPLTAWKLETAQRAWVRHNALPEAQQTQRLVYMFERYYDGIEYDLRHHLGESAGELWRSRRWRELLGYIDQLPGNSHMNRLLSNDEEYMEAVLRKSKGGGSSRPSMADWGQLESMVATLIDEVRRNTAVQQAIANPKAPKPRVDPYPRPATSADKVDKKIQKERHDEMVSILLPQRNQVS